MSDVSIDEGDVTPEQGVNTDRASQALANANSAATAFLDFQAKIALVLSTLSSSEFVSKVNIVDQKVAKMNLEILTLKKQVESSVGADDPDFQTPAHTAPRGNDVW